MIRIATMALAGLVSAAFWAMGPVIDFHRYTRDIPDLCRGAQGARRLSMLVLRVRVPEDVLRWVAQAAEMAPECVRSIESHPGACVSILGERTDVVVMRREQPRGEGESTWVGVNLVSSSSSPPPYPILGMRLYGRPEFTDWNSRMRLYLLGVPPEEFIERCGQGHPVN